MNLNDCTVLHGSRDLTYVILICPPPAGGRDINGIRYYTPSLQNSAWIDRDLWVIIAIIVAIKNIVIFPPAYRKFTSSRSISLAFLLHLTVHACCTGPLELGPKLPSSNSFFSAWSANIHFSVV